MSIANYLTLIRLLVGPLFLLLYWQHEALGISPVLLPYGLLSLWIISEMSDALDGYLARKYNEVTELGKILDPMADSITRLTIFLTFTLAPIGLPLFLVLLVFYRDSIISTLRTVCALKGITLAARTSGKIKAVIQAVVSLLVILLMIPHSLGYVSTQTLNMSATVLVGIATLYTLASGIDYLAAHFQHIKKMLLLKKKPSES